MPAEVIRVFGLRELRRALKNAEDRSPDELKRANIRAAEIVVREAQRRAPRGPHQGRGKPNPITPIAQSIKAGATAGKGLIIFGGTHSPHAPVYEFGGEIPRRGTRATHGALIKQAQARHRRFSGLGIPTTAIRKRPYVYPALAAKRDEVLDAYEQALLRITRDL